MPLRYRIRILDHLSHDSYQPAVASDIARELRIDQDERDAFQEAIASLQRDNLIEIGRDDRVRLPEFGDEMTGKFRLNARGFGFVIPDTPFRHGDLFIPRGATMDAISGDRVRVAIREQEGRGKQPGKSPYVGRIVEVIERGQSQFVGVLMKRDKQWMVEPDGKQLHDPIVIRDLAKNAKAGDKVVVELLHYPEDDYLPEGVITKVLGEAGRPDVETEAVIEAHGLRVEFDDEVLQQARNAARGFEDQVVNEKDTRLDLTDEFIFTIDPPDAKDFDDAISIKRDEQSGEWTLGVHIADVAHFVSHHSPLDIEARTRGNSTYLPRLVLPMLPELLSNGVCSLQEGAERFTKSVFITFDNRGQVIHQRVAATLIKSRKRLTYLEAQALIDGDEKTARKEARTEPNYTEQLVDKLKLANSLAVILRKRRRGDGMIVLNLPDVELIFDDDGHVVGAEPEDDAFTHTIIEMFMVEANEALARLFDSLNIPILRRIHPDPVAGDVDDLRVIALAAGHRVPDEPTRHDLQQLLEATKDSPAARAVHFAVLRTLTKASYSPAMIGHFALASDHYAHFTSPIRRYPDLTLHRALAAYLEFTDNGTNTPGGKKRKQLAKRLATDERVLDEARLIDLGRHCSDTEKQSEEAERELRDFLVMQFLHDNHLGDEFEGVVTGVMKWGVFISIEKFLVEGMVRPEDMPQSSKKAERWVHNEHTGRLVASRSGMSIGLGDVVRVQIMQVDPASRHLDLAVAELPKRAALETVAAGAGGGNSEGRSRGKGKSKDKGGKRKGYGKGRRGRRGR